MAELRKVTIKIPEDTYAVIEKMAKKDGGNVSETIRKLLTKSLNVDWFNDNQDIMASLIRQQMEVVIKPHVERISKLSSKTGHMSATATFLNVQALMDLVPKEKRKDVKDMYESARKKSVEYMKTKTDDWESEF